MSEKLSKSPQRNAFQRGKYLQRKSEEGKTPDNDENVKAMEEMYDRMDAEKAKQEADPAWAKDNLEYDLRTTDWILEKVRSQEYYAQNLYAAMCNNDFQKIDLWPVLKDQRWSCSWRYAGGIIADMRQEGDYIDWYCSGIRNEIADEEYSQLSKEYQERYLYMRNHFVGEGVVTDEIKEDLLKLGWTVIEHNDTSI